jgi:hypothetical protein
MKRIWIEGDLAHHDDSQWILKEPDFELDIPTHLAYAKDDLIYIRVTSDGWLEVLGPADWANFETLDMDEAKQIGLNIYKHSCLEDRLEFAHEVWKEERCQK